MKNYFIPGVSPEQKQKLQEAAVAFCDFEIDGATGLVVDEDNIARTLEVLEVAIESEITTSIEGIVKISLGEGMLVAQPAPKVAVVETVNYEKCRCGHWKDLVTKVAEWAKKTVTNVSVAVHYAYRMTETVQFCEGLNIVLGSAVGGEGDINKVSYVPAMGQIGFKNIPECPNDFHYQMVVENLERLLPIILATGDEAEKIREKMLEAKRVASREAYVKECSRRFEKTVQGTKDAVAKGLADIAKLQQELTKRIRETQGAERKLEQIENFRTENTASYGKEFDSLLQIPGVENVETSDGVIKVFTEHIYITPDKCADTYDIGKFRMEIYTAGSNGGIRFFNLTRQGTGDGYNTNHPHVKRDGSPCLGNISEQIANLIGEYEYSAVAQIGLQYLQSVNTGDSAGRGIFDYWPKKEKKEESNG